VASRRRANNRPTVPQLGGCFLGPPSHLSDADGTTGTGGVDGSSLEPKGLEAWTDDHAAFGLSSAQPFPGTPLTDGLGEIAGGRHGRGPRVHLGADSMFY
jgi:hypothetical protein